MPSRSVPRANTGSVLLESVSDFFTCLLQLERRFDPFIRPAFDAFLRDPIAELTTEMINRKRPNEGLKIAEEKLMPGEEEYLDSIISSFIKQMHLLWKSGGFERGGNTKTHGIVRGEFIVHDNLPPALRHGIYAEPKTYRAWVRFSGPGPYITPDIEDVGFMSISIKLMGVSGPKLMDDEKFTQDMFGVSTPTFVTPDTKANAQLQIESVKNAQIFYFLNFVAPTCSISSCNPCGSRRRAARLKLPTSVACPICSAKGRRCNIRFGRNHAKRLASRGCLFDLHTTICARRWSLRLPKVMSSSTCVCSCKPTRI